MARFTRKPRFRRFSRFRRKSRGTWFPILGNGWVPDEGSTWWSASFSGTSGPVNDNRGNGPQQNCFPLTKDVTSFSNTTVELDGPSLRDIVEGQEWKLRRIVGQLHILCTDTNTGFNSTPWPNIEVAAGIFVARINDTDQTLPDLTFDEVDPLNTRNVQNPWIWRNSWILQRPLSSNIGFSAMPSSNNWNDASSRIDAKSIRRIHREERLWFVLGTTGWAGPITSTTPTGDPTTTSQPQAFFHLDVRLFGGMVRGKNGGSF